MPILIVLPWVDVDSMRSRGHSSLLSITFRGDVTKGHEAGVPKLLLIIRLPWGATQLDRLWWDSYQRTSLITSRSPGAHTLQHKTVPHRQIPAAAAATSAVGVQLRDMIMF